MLKVSNKARKNEHLETMSIIDKCTKIMKEDRLALRQLVKEDNIKLIELVAKHKKKPDLNDLQTELRKFLKEKKGNSIEETTPQPIQLRKVKSKERYEWTSNARSPSRSHLDFRKKNKDESTRKQDSSKKNEALDSAQKSSRHQNPQDTKILDDLKDPKEDLPEVKPIAQEKFEKTVQSITHPFQDDLTPIKMEFQTIVSQAPLNQSDQRSECILQYNVAEIKQYMEEDKHYVSKGAFTVPQLFSLSYRALAPEAYRDLFTDWRNILAQQPPHYAERQAHILPAELENMETKQSYIPEIKTLEIRGVTAEELFTYLVHNRFSKRLNLYQIKENARISIPDAQIDFEQLFKMADQNSDGWITLEELGRTLAECCTDKEQKPNKIKGLYQSLNGKITKESFIKALNDKIQAEILYHEIDLFGKGALDYWELYNHYEEIDKYL